MFFVVVVVVWVDAVRVLDPHTAAGVLTRTWRREDLTGFLLHLPAAETSGHKGGNSPSLPRPQSRTRR